MSIQKRCTKLRQNLQEFERRQRLQAIKEENRCKERFQEQVDETISKLYSVMKHEVHHGFGFITKKRLLLRCSAIEQKETRQEIINRCGIVVKPDPKDSNYVTISRFKDSDDHVKICRASDQICYFPQLFWEDERRTLLWLSNVQEIAKQWTDRCIQHLEYMPGKFYGIPNHVTLRDRNGCSAFSGDFSFSADLSSITCNYSNLTNDQLYTIERWMDSTIAHAVISITRASHSNVVWVTFNKDPFKIIEPPYREYYNYASFYEQYDRVTPELQTVFNDITRHTQPLSLEQQSRTLDSKRQLVYYADDNSDTKQIWKLLRDRVSETPREKALIQTVQCQHPGIVITGCRFLNREETHRPLCGRTCASSTNSYDERIEFDLEIISLYSIATFQILTAELKVETFKQRCLTEIANQLVEYILTDAEGYFKDKYYYSEIVQLLNGARLEIGNRDLYSHVDYSFAVDNYIIKLFDIKDPEFRSQLQQRVSDLTNGFIQITYPYDQWIDYTLSLS